uniref:GUN4-like domain-containing protein n=1 Tax=Dasya binghamiae TaxID=1896963 RepID=A0A1C8XRV0_9FLOR|nr:hypothetical protein BI108_pgp186 [Dasya binghamiae]AOH77221.1 hypothetical protein [Dasya binghamiae]
MKKTNNTVKNLSTLNQINQLFEDNNTNISQEIIDKIEYIINNKLIEQEQLINILITRLIINRKNQTQLDQIILEKLKKTEISNIKNKLNIAFNKNIKQFQSSIYLKLNYTKLQKLLIHKNFKEADKLTQEYLCKLANLHKQNRKWLYFTDIPLIPKEDLFTIDLLWQIYSNGKFGFSIQQKIWKTNNKNWDIFLEKIGWIEHGRMKRYPDEFIWQIDAPKGHLPLFNQLRGIQVLSYLFELTLW